jgi:hypothetical protein
LFWTEIVRYWDGEQDQITEFRQKSGQSLSFDAGGEDFCSFNLEVPGETRFRDGGTGEFSEWTDNSIGLRFSRYGLTWTHTYRLDYAIPSPDREWNGTRTGASPCLDGSYSVNERLIHAVYYPDPNKLDKYWFSTSFEIAKT